MLSRKLFYFIFFQILLIQIIKKNFFYLNRKPGYDIWIYLFKFNQYILVDKFKESFCDY